MVRDYWKRAGRRAFTESSVQLGLLSWGAAMIRALVAAAVILVLLFAGSEDASRDEFLARLAGVAIIIMLFPLVFAWNLFRAPAKMERDASESADTKIDELVQRVRSLEDRRVQILEFDFRADSDNKYIEDVPNQGGVRVGRIAAKNTHEFKSVIDVETMLINYWDFHQQKRTTVNIILTDYSSGQTRNDIHSGRSATYNLFRVQQDGSIWLGPRPDGQYHSIPAGRYRFKITASSRDNPSLFGFFHLSVGADGAVEWRPVQPGDALYDIRLNPT